MDLIEVSNLSYTFSPEFPLSLDHVSINLPRGSRTLLVGANGAGKSTLLRLLAGKSLAKAGNVSVFGNDPFRESKSTVVHLGTEWVNNPVVHRDMIVARLIASVGGDVFPERRDMLISILDIDLRWRMHAISDGERRRVQLCMGLLRPFDLLLLDEVTVDLDVLARSDLLSFLSSETETRKATIVYATHIFDGLAKWPTHLVHMSQGKIVDSGPVSNFPEIQSVTNTGNSALLETCLTWIKEDIKVRGSRENEKRSTWQDVQDTFKTGTDVFTDYFKISRAR
ncbi:CCR4-Not complex ATPase subunit Caf16 [Schizosaccharomyces osmophilus]|uniref:CCR4-Not complex ATPase subunit Caf16 n=1 Tax=Schizosaccharomyces osmophilus TaxID=2545709 RepID=A0AAF0AX79_9SCHI|nr:CCR4-Not complex ATPase subunit Caf16 [Schizosaccharomyces osmophilus]WBW74522.1 CCR4-Not complex ATPase subunit Caf16 [Schizosaccharomyces osmophilus]